MFEVLKNIQGDVGQIMREQVSQGPQPSSIEDHMRGTRTYLCGMQGDVADLKMRVDRIEKRLGLADTEH
ncbi:hypothetical protein [Sphingomonas solaris]|uniref:Uncharacterized protein n=1 Tax=Alterirhizorhabdus solaris TaxID=2529389 RepID=A0A558R725_9SPHN|nr:hypothetical protein [Sphingomonas solaris]TVV75185.1 hypothetical protein FOY91_07825 [Sphingomonas solaris]